MKIDLFDRQENKTVADKMADGSGGSDVDGIVQGVSDVNLGDRTVLDNEAYTSITDLPSILIVTNLEGAVFENVDLRESFEMLFLKYDANAQFQYLKSFRRARVVFTSPITAANARIHLHEAEIAGKIIKCYFAQQKEADHVSTSPSLHPPEPTKQFLISPPASPPVGWEPITEAEPVINYDLLHALANLAPGEAHELHPQSDNHPGIIVHVCEDPVGFQNRGKIMQTKRPERT